MKTLAYAMVLLIITASCNKKNEPTKDILEGVWVETTLRLDTLDFTINQFIDNGSGYKAADFKTNSYSDTVLNPNYPVNHSSQYNYFINQGNTALNLRSFYSSFSGFQQYNFTINNSLNRFTVQKFYTRRSLPPAIEFERIR